MKKLLMLGTSLASIEMIEYAKSIGVYTIVTDYLEPEKSVAKLVADEYWMINTSELDILEKKCREEGVSAVICGVSEFNLEMTMELCRRLNLPSYCTPEAWHFSRDKADFKKLCLEVGAPIAKDFYLNQELPDAELDKVNFPVVVKPIDLSGNRGISYCYNKDELRKAYKYALSLSKSQKIVVEKMLKGKEWYSYYAIADGEIRLLALNSMIAQSGELKNLYSLTTTISDNVQRFIDEINPKIEEVLKKVGCKEGIAWVQVMLDEDNNFYIIEMGYRLPGDMPFVNYDQLCNFDSIKWLVDYSLGKKYTKEDLPAALMKPMKSCGIAYSLWSNCEGKIKEIKGLEELKEKLGVRSFTLQKIGDSFDYHRPIGVITFARETIDETIKALKTVNEILCVNNLDGDNSYIRYTDYDYLKDLYMKGISE